MIGQFTRGPARQALESWGSLDHHEGVKRTRRIPEDMQTIGLEELATILGRSPKYMRVQASQGPDLLPPRFRTGGQQRCAGACLSMTLTKKPPRNPGRFSPMVPVGPTDHHCLKRTAVSTTCRVFVSESRTSIFFACSYKTVASGLRFCCSDLNCQFSRQLVATVDVGRLWTPVRPALETPPGPCIGWGMKNPSRTPLGKF